MKDILLFCLIFCISGCELNKNPSVIPSYEDVTNNYYLPRDLEHCKVFLIKQKDGYGIPLYVFHCQNGLKATNGNCGKGCNLSVNVVD